MRCSDFLKNLHQFADNALDDELRKDAEAHLKECRKCSSELNSLKTLLQCLTQIRTGKTSTSGYAQKSVRFPL
jgi:anti-sigma factor RsiW